MTTFLLIRHGLHDLSGKGLAGSLIKNEQLATDMSLIMSNLQVLSSNINNKGLWSVIRKPKVSAAKK